MNDHTVAELVVLLDDQLPKTGVAPSASPVEARAPSNTVHGK